MNELILIIFQGYLILVVLQTGLWAIQNHTKDASTADVGWAIGMSVLVGWYAVNLEGNTAVSYTHLDVYKRQGDGR